MKIQHVYSRLLILLLVLTGEPVASEPAVHSADVYVQVKELGGAVETLRHHMGVPQANRLNLYVRDAQPHDVFFQAMTLFRKSDRLLFQMTRHKAQVPETQPGLYRPVDVMELVVAARGYIELVLKDLGLATPTNPVPRDATKTPSDVFLAIQGVNRQLNLLLDRPFSPSEAYMQVTVAISYAARQLARFPGTVRIPPAPRVEPGRVPSDVFFRLLVCLDRISEIYRMEKLPSLEVDAGGIRKPNITPSDVFDIASLLVARLDFLHKHFSIKVPPREPFYPGRVFPTDVFRQAGILQVQLDQLLDNMNPPET